MKLTKEIKEVVSAAIIIVIFSAIMIPLFVFALDRAITIEEQKRKEEIRESLKMYHMVTDQ